MSSQILVIDPIAVNRIILRSRVAASCHTVTQVARPEGAGALAAEIAPDLVLLGPGLGIEAACALTREIRANHATAIVPVLILTQTFDAAGVRAALAAGAEDALDPAMQTTFLLARIRLLLRQRSVLDELIARNQTDRVLGLAEAAAQFRSPGLVALVTENTSRGRGWQAALAPCLPHQMLCMTPQQALSGDDAGARPDLYVVEDNPDRPDDCLRFLAELRSRREARGAAVILISTCRGNMQDESRLAMALDIGASDVLRNGFDAAELALRANVQITRKRDDDRLRNQVRDGLRDAVRDPLTGLYNRRYALQHLDNIARRAMAQGRRFAVMMVDVDRFKTINDTFGHAAGDAALIEVAARLRLNIRKQDLLARIGGEEFLVVMPDTDPDRAHLAASRLCREVAARPIALPGPGQSTRITVSIGIALSDADPADPALPLEPTERRVSRLLSSADEALYAAKSSGRNKVTICRSAA